MQALYFLYTFIFSTINFLYIFYCNFYTICHFIYSILSYSITPAIKCTLKKLIWPCLVFYLSLVKEITIGIFFISISQENTFYIYKRKILFFSLMILCYTGVQHIQSENKLRLTLQIKICWKNH